MRKAFFWFGWTILFLIPLAFVVEIILLDDLPHVAPWKWVVLFGAVVLIYFTRNPDSVLEHHVV